MPGVTPRDVGIGLLFTHIGDAVIAAEAESGRVVLWNPAAERIFGYRPDEVLGQSIDDLLPGLRETPRWAAPLSPHAGLVAPALALHGRHKHGHDLPLEVSLSPLAEAPNGRRLMLAIARDVGDRTRADETQRFLAAAGRVLASSLGYEATLSSVARLAVPAIADYCFIDVLEEDGTVRRAEVAHADPSQQVLLQDLAQRFPPNLELPGGPVARALMTGTPQLMSNLSDADLRGLAENAEHLRMLRALEPGSFISVPLIARGRTLGALTFATAASVRRYGPPDVELAQELANQAAMAVDNALLLEQAQQSEREARALYQAALALAGDLGLTTRLERVLDAALEVMRVGQAHLALVDPSGAFIDVVAARGVGVQALGVRQPIGGGLLGEVVARNQAVRSDDSLTDPRVWDRSPSERQGMRSWLGVPMADRSEVLGVLTVLSPRPHAFGARDERLLASLAALAAAAVREARLYEQAQEEILERRRAEEALEHRALHDALTGLPNRVLLQDRLALALLVARREERRLAFLLMDLDRFKDVNDTLGHHAGDLLLQQVGQRLQAALRASDTVARLGGDEFGVILPTGGERNGVEVAQRLLQALEPAFVVEGQSIHVGASIGIALCPDHGSDPETLMRRADVAMYQAKRGGNGYAEYTADQDEHSSTRLTLIGELRQAIEQDELLLHFQPLVEFGEGRFSGVEALVRWRHPRRGLVPPDQFIPLAEQTGLIKGLSHWVLNAALRQRRLWAANGVQITVAVNLSMRNLHDPLLPSLIADLLTAWDTPASALRLEITESAVMAEPARTLDVLSRVRALGVRIAIDDFGTGYSSLGYLKRLPVDELKVDRTFVSGMATDENDAAIVRATINLAHHLGLRVIAEGVENAAPWDLLASLGCDEAQGYYLSRPLPEADRIHWLRESPWAVGQPLEGD